MLHNHCHAELHSSHVTCQGRSLFKIQSTHEEQAECVKKGTYTNSVDPDETHVTCQGRSLPKIQRTHEEQAECVKKGIYTNSEDPDETPQKVASHQGMHCLPR